MTRSIKANAHLDISKPHPMVTPPPLIHMRLVAKRISITTLMSFQSGSRHVSLPSNSKSTFCKTLVESSFLPPLQQNFPVFCFRVLQKHTTKSMRATAVERMFPPTDVVIGPNARFDVLYSLLFPLFLAQTERVRNDIWAR